MKLLQKRFRKCENFYIYLRLTAFVPSLQQGLQDKGYEEWVGEMVGMREILRHFSNISKGEVVGMRAPFLKPGRNTQYKVTVKKCRVILLKLIIYIFKVLEDFGYIYDSSVGAPALAVPVWPYTLDYQIPHECKSGTCPTKSFPGINLNVFNAFFP